MSLITRMRRQQAVLFEANGTDSYGKPTYAQPVQIKCRWEDVAKEYIKANGETAMSQAVVYPERDVKPKDVLMLGTLDDVTAPDDPKANEGAFEVMRFDKLPTIRATEFLLTAYL